MIPTMRNAVGAAAPPTAPTCTAERCPRSRLMTATNPAPASRPTAVRSPLKGMPSWISPRVAPSMQPPANALAIPSQRLGGVRRNRKGESSQSGSQRSTERGNKDRDCLHSQFIVAPRDDGCIRRGTDRRTERPNTSPRSVLVGRKAAAPSSDVLGFLLSSTSKAIPVPLRQARPGVAAGAATCGRRALPSPARKPAPRSVSAPMPCLGRAVTIKSDKTKGVEHEGA